MSCKLIVHAPTTLSKFSYPCKTNHAGVATSYDACMHVTSIVHVQEYSYSSYSYIYKKKNKTAKTCVLAIYWFRTSGSIIPLDPRGC